MIDVVLQPIGDSAEVETPEQAVVAARYLWDEADVRSTRPRIVFLVDGQQVWSTTRRSDLGTSRA